MRFYLQRLLREPQLFSATGTSESPHQVPVIIPVVKSTQVKTIRPFCDTATPGIPFELSVHKDTVKTPPAGWPPASRMRARRRPPLLTSFSCQVITEVPALWDANAGAPGREPPISTSGPPR